SFQVGAKDNETISISLTKSDSYNLYNATGATAATTGQTINGNKRSTAAEGFDVLKGTVAARKSVLRTALTSRVPDCGRLDSTYSPVPGLVHVSVRLCPPSMASRPCHSRFGSPISA
ncbi:hypothetical protein Q9155_22205, partial [Kosakonia cowanii]|nr:hypothetical protein [Kosakonia cowanii]